MKDLRPPGVQTINSDYFVESGSGSSPYSTKKEDWCSRQYSPSHKQDYEYLREVKRNIGLKDEISPRKHIPSNYNNYSSYSNLNRYPSEVGLSSYKFTSKPYSNYYRPENRLNTPRVTKNYGLYRPEQKIGRSRNPPKVYHP